MIDRTYHKARLQIIQVNLWVLDLCLQLGLNRETIALEQDAMLDEAVALELAKVWREREEATR